MNGGPWAPLYINAEVPAGAHLNWTVLDASTGEPIDGMSGSNDRVIPVNALDWQTYTSLASAVAAQTITKRRNGDGVFHQR